MKKRLIGKERAHTVPEVVLMKVARCSKTFSSYIVQPDAFTCNIMLIFILFESHVTMVTLLLSTSYFVTGIDLFNWVT